MRLTWADQAPSGISFEPEQQILSKIEDLGKSAGYEVVDSSTLDFDTRSFADMVLKTKLGLLLFGVCQKSHNSTARIDIETRPNSSYRTRHLLLQQRNGSEWELRNDSDLPEGSPPNDSQGLEHLVEKLFGGR